MMKFNYSLLASALLLAGCNGSGSETSASDSIAPTYSVSGTISAINATGNETVCADLNGDFACNANEPTTQAEQGAFTLTSADKAILSSPIVAQIDTGVTTLSSQRMGAQTDAPRQANAFLVAPGVRKTTGNEINVISTLVASNMAAGDAYQDAVAHLREQFEAMGVTTQEDLLASGADNRFVQLENNVLSLISGMTPTRANRMLALLSGELARYSDVLLKGAPSDAELNAILVELDERTQMRPVNDTGIVSYYSDSGNVTTAPDDYPGQDADYGFDATEGGFSLTKLDGNGQPLPDSATTWDCVQDNRSGLVWESKQTDPQSPRYVDRLFAYQVPRQFEPFGKDIEATGCKDAEGICTTAQYQAYLNQQQICGIDQWRLPTFVELYSLIDFGETQTDSDGRVYGLDTGYFPHQSSASEYDAGLLWSSTSFLTEYTAFATPGARYIQLPQTRGSDRGTTVSLEIYSDQVDSDYTSWQLPIRLVAQGEK